jgi:hypothetical protein
MPLTSVLTISMLGLFTLLAVAAQSAPLFMTNFADCGVDIGVRLFRKAGSPGGLHLSGRSPDPGPPVGEAVSDAVQEMIGSDPSLTGRTKLLGWVLNAVAEGSVFA